MVHQPVRIISDTGGERQEWYRFDNGYGASIVDCPHRPCLNLAVIWWDHVTFRVVEDTPVADDTIDITDPMQAAALLDEIAALVPAAAGTYPDRNYDGIELMDGIICPHTKPPQA